MGSALFHAQVPITSGHIVLGVFCALRASRPAHGHAIIAISHDLASPLADDRVAVLIIADSDVIIATNVAKGSISVSALPGANASVQHNCPAAGREAPG